MEDCDIGKTIDDACHKTHHTRNRHLKLLSELDINTQNVLLWRAGLKNELLNAASTKVCFHHELKFGSSFERLHTKTVKGGHKITFEMAKMPDGKDIQLVPGFQLCRSCFKEAQTHCHDVSEVEDYDITIATDSYSSKAEEDPSEKHPKIDNDDSLQSIGISPIKIHSIPKHVKVSYAHEKVDKTMSTLKQSFATAIGIEKQDLCETENTKLSNKLKEN